MRLSTVSVLARFDALLIAHGLVVPEGDVSDTTFTGCLLKLAAGQGPEDTALLPQLKDWRWMTENVDTDPSGGLLDRVKGAAKQVAGAVTGNEQLKREGDLHQERAAAQQAAAQAQAEAEKEQASAEVTQRETEIATERQRLAAEAAADERQAQIERESDAKERQVHAAAEARQELAEQQRAAQEQTADQLTGAAVTERLAADRAAADIEAQAEQAKRAAANVDQQIEATS